MTKAAISGVTVAITKVRIGTNHTAINRPTDAIVITTMMRATGKNREITIAITGITPIAAEVIDFPSG